MDSPDKQSALTLLLVDDDTELCAMMREFFTQSGHRLDCVHSGREGLACALNGAYDLVILDGMLPVLDGLEILKQIRRRKTVPVIMLTARVRREDRILGLDSGADDYLPKPFDPDELLARIRAVLRRGHGERRPGWQTLEVADIRLDSGTRQVWRKHTAIELTETEFDLLEMLIRAAGRIVSRDEITAALFDREATPYDRFLDVHISHLRKKLEDGRKLIRTIRGVGYLFTGAD